MRRSTRSTAAAVLSVGILLAGCADDGADTGEVEPGVDDPETGEMVEDLEGIDPTSEATTG